MAAKRAITPADVMDMAEYAEVRQARRAAITELKRHRRIAVGPFATFYFESYDTMWMQVHEMLFIERGGAEQVSGELEAYNPLIPQGDDLRVTLMLEIADPARRERELARLGGIEETAFIQLDDQTIRAEPLEDEIERTTPEGKTSSVHFLRFAFTPAQIAAFRDSSVRATIGFDHAAYGHIAVIPAEMRAALAADFD